VTRSVRERRVVLVCGPPGAGKTTLAKSLGLEVYDLDDPQWGDSERLFKTHLRRLASDPSAHAVVIRAGATLTARAAAQALIQATEVTVVETPADECIRRVIERNRPRPPMNMQIAAVRRWWERYEPGTPETRQMPAPSIGEASRDW